MSIDINTYPISPAIISTLRREGHQHNNIRTIKDVIDYILFTFLCTLEVHDRTFGTKEVRLVDLESDGYTRQLAVESPDNLVRLWESSLNQALIWVGNHKSMRYTDYTRGQTVFTALFGNITHENLQNLKDSVSLASSTHSTTDSFPYGTVTIKVEMAKRLITYCEMILGITQHQLEPSAAVPIVEPIAPLSAASPTYPPMNGPVPFDLIDDTDTPGIDGQTFTITLDESARPITDSITPLNWTRQGVLEEYGAELVDFIEEEWEADLDVIDHEDLMGWVQVYRETMLPSELEEDEPQPQPQPITNGQEEGRLPW